MSGPLRDRKGCWTCRLRKKKCRISHPRCSTCESLMIPCYGFGPKPDWMDGGEQEKAVSNSLKEIVKHTSRRKPVSRVSNQEHPAIEIAPKSSSTPTEPPTLTLEVAEPKQATCLQDEALPPDPSHSILDAVVASISSVESILLMHYLDCVFSVQFPMYQPPAAAGGRGWLLSILLRTKPLFHATLALSAFHRRVLVDADTSHLCRVTAVVQQEEHLEIGIRSVNEIAQNFCPHSGLGVMTAVLQLMFYELFTGNHEAWKAHLLAATNMYHRANGFDFKHVALEPKSITILREDLHLSELGTPSAEEVLHFRFLRSSMFWVDIISSVTSGTAPRLLPQQFCAITPDGQTRLEYVMGCKNSIMLQIWRISALNARKIEAMQQRRFDCTDFVQDFHDITLEVQSWLATEGQEALAMGEDPPTIIFDRNSSTLITYLFAQMALVYLHLVTIGFQELEALDSTRSKVMVMLQSDVVADLLTALVCPLFMFGVIAKPADEAFFRDVLSSPSLLQPTLKHRERILPTLEESWKGRTRPGFQWKDVLETTSDLLLI